MQSMTGYGRSEVHNEQMTLTVEARSVNHRHLDIAWRYPRVFTPLEARMKQRVSAYFSRGRLDIKITQQNAAEARQALAPDYALAQQYYAALRNVQETLQLPGTIDLGMVMELRDIVKMEDMSTEAVEASWGIIAEGLEAALAALQSMRQQEGAVLGKDLQARLHIITRQVEAIRQRVPQVVVTYKERLAQRVQDLFDQFELDPDRVAQEAILFAERSDITEELTRLEAHIQAFHSHLSASEAIGRKLEFLLQEMNREVNTIGSKSNDVEIAHNVVEIKSELERCREQIQNIE